MTQIPSLFVSTSPLGGRGVFTAVDIAAGSVVESAPVLVVPPAQVAIIHQTALHDYYFRWGEDMDAAAILLGLGSLYNHSFTPNLRIEMDFGNATVDFYALENIAAGSELTFNYNGDPEDKSPLWFHSAGKR